MYALRIQINICHVYSDTDLAISCYRPQLCNNGDLNSKLGHKHSFNLGVVESQDVFCLTEDVCSESNIYKVHVGVG